ncbi:hypothetical protein AK812_SmicGene35831 [Symbiodinium microadriaticum]|uniref:Uncharacterized protein n=1 Tax=Symbiodinium microadriaticum TaxID=2951 RepID=A0A1Q9CKJ2_SYMMI|nr:hypothetical protein AK812_SmicGene35831 [Symbiodinium microadriaticum]
MTAQRALALLKLHSGSWNMQLMELLFQFWESGTNPYQAVQGLDTEENDAAGLRALSFSVLADSTNQDKLRSMLKIFGPARNWMAQLDSDVQTNVHGSVRQAIQLATGARVQQLLRDTIQQTTCWESLVYINITEASHDETAAETMALHCEMLCHWLCRLHELADHHRVLPWKAILAVHSRRYATLLESLRLEWDLIQMLDQLSSKSKVFEAMSFTRWQPVREMLVQAESIDFNPNHECADQVRDVFLAAAGLTGAEDAKQSSLLSSLGNELTFNGLRDGERRSQKADFRAPAAMAAGAVKSAWKRSPLEHLSLESKDWADRDASRYLKNFILKGAKQIDQQLGIPMTDLTTKRQLDVLTKPAVLSANLRLYVCLLQEFSQNRTIDIEGLLSDVWTLKLLSACTLWKLSEDEDAEIRLVLQSGSWTAQFLAVDPVEVDGEFYYRIPSQACVQDTVTFKPLQGCLSLARGVAKCEFGLLFKAEAWMTPTRYLCAHRVLQMPSSFIAAWCRLLGLQLGRCSDAERVRQLLQREAFDDAYIQELEDDKTDDEDADDAAQQEVLADLNFSIAEDAVNGQEAPAGEAQAAQPPAEAALPEHLEHQEPANDPAAPAAVDEGYAIPAERAVGATWLCPPFSRAGMLARHPEAGVSCRLASSPFVEE